MDALLTRRALAATLPLAALVAAPAVAMQQSPTQHADEELLDLVDQFHVADARRRELDRLVDEVFECIDFPDIPDALVWRPSDFPGICTDPGRCAQYLIEGKLQYVYEGHEDIASWWTDPNPPQNPHAFSERDRPRAKEIVDGIAQWEAANKRAEEEAGYTKAYEMARRETERCDELRRRIIFAKAHTPDGMMAKVRAMVSLFHDDPTWIEKRLQEAVARNDSADISRWFGMSLALDAVNQRYDAALTTARQKGAAA